MKNQALSLSDVLAAFAKPVCRRVTQRIVSTLRSMTEGLQSGEDSGLTTIWDEICVQIQWEESAYWLVYEDLIRDAANEELGKLPPHERAALWLQTPQGDDWIWEEEDEREQNPVCTDDIVEYVASEVHRTASNYSNPRIRAYLDKQYNN